MRHKQTAHFIIVFFLLSACNSFMPAKYSNKATIKSGGEFYEFSFIEKDIKPQVDITYYYIEHQQLKNGEGFYKGKLLDGEFTSYNYDSNQPITNGFFNEGLKEGEWKYFGTDGELVKVEKWKKGKLKPEKTEELNSKITEVDEQPQDSIRNISLFKRFSNIFRKDSTKAP